jgi:hypothetical protein
MDLVDGNDCRFMRMEGLFSNGVVEWVVERVVEWGVEMVEVHFDGGDWGSYLRE